MHYIKIPENPWFQLTTPLTSFRAPSSGCSQTGVNASAVIQAPPKENLVKTISLRLRAGPGCHLYDLSNHWVRRWLHRCPSLSCLSCSHHLCSHDKLAEELLQRGSRKELQDSFCRDKNLAEQELKLIPERLPKAFWETSPKVLS